MGSSLSDGCWCDGQFPPNNNIGFINILIQMNQGFKKTKALQVGDTTVLTPPTRADEQRNSRRTQQITNLHQEFQDLKKKIKEVEIKNERILDKIYKAYNFKKKSAYTEEYIPSGADSPVVHYEHKNVYSGAMSLDAHSNKSDHSEKESKVLPKANDQLSRKSQKSQKYNYSLDNGKTDPNIGSSEMESMLPKQHHLRYTTSQIPVVGSRKKLMEELSQEKQYLEQQLTQKSLEINKLRSSLQGFNRGMKGQLKDTLEEFEEVVCQKTLAEIQKMVKKHEQKLKKVTMMLRDRQEELKSTKLLREGKRRRSASRSKRPSSPPRIVNRASTSQGNRQNESRSRSKVGEQGERNKKQFQEIANKYEELIKTKNEQIEKWDKKYKLKERECYELKIRIEMLQKRVSEEERRASKAGEEQEPRSNKKLNTESDLLESDRSKHDNFNIFEDEVLSLQTKLQQITVELTQKSTQAASLQTLLATAENKSKMLHSEYMQNLTKNKQKYQQEQERFKREYEKVMADKSAEVLGFKNSVMASEKKFLEKECECFALETKLKKAEGVLGSRDRKIEELEKLVGENCPTDRSLLLNSMVLNTADSGIEAIKKLKEEIEQLEAQLDTGKAEIFELKRKNNQFKSKAEEGERLNAELRKELETLRGEVEQLRLSSSQGQVAKGEEDESGLECSVERLASQLQAQQQKTAGVLREKEEWYDKYQKIKSQNLQKESEGIKLKSQLGFAEKSLGEAQASLGQFRTENEALKLKNKELSCRLAYMEDQFKGEREDFKTQLNDIEKKMTEYKDDIKPPAPLSEKEDKNLQLSVVDQSKLDQLNSQNEYLLAKLKEAKAELETQEVIEQKIISEYKLNMEQTKLELKVKTEQLVAQKDQIEDLNTTIRNLTARMEAISQTDSPSKKELKTQLLSRMEELEQELKETKEINSKLTDMESQLFDQIKIKEEERGELYEELRKKEARIQELEEIVEVREPEHLNTYSSHISQSTQKRESIKSQSSLKYSSHSQALRKSRMAASGKSGTSHEEKLFDLDLSEAGTQFYEQPSQISNISEFFGREELLTDKIKIKRQEQIKLFEKTAAYIKSLKKAMEEKSKRIKLLQKKIELLKQSELVRKELGRDIDMGEENVVVAGTLVSDDTFRDYESEHLEYRKGNGYLRRYRQLENDTKLVREENITLTQQVETMEEELLKAEEQENSLVKIKDLYKDEIKKLIKKNEQQTKAFEEELKNERKRVEESESVHIVEAVKQLSFKIVNIAGFMLTEENISSKRKEQKRKELEEYIKVMSNILKLDKKVKETILQCLHK